MGSAFDLGFQQVGENMRQKNLIAEQQRQQKQNTVGATLLNAINNAKNIKPPTDPMTITDETGKEVPNPTYVTKKKNYDDAQAATTNLLSQYAALNSPEQHASFGQHLHGLIFGKPTQQEQQPLLSTNSSPVTPTPDPNAAPVAAPDSTPAAPIHPMAAAPANHPLHAITAGISALGNHLKAFANPLPPEQQPDTALIAKYYRDPADVANERAKELWGVRGENALNLQDKKNEYLKTMMQGRRPSPIGDFQTIPSLISEMENDPDLVVAGPDGHVYSPEQLKQLPAGFLSHKYMKGNQVMVAFGDPKTKMWNVAGMDLQVPTYGPVNVSGPDANVTPLGQATSTLSKKSSSTDPFGLTTKASHETVVPPISSAAPQPPASAAPVSQSAPAAPPSVAQVNQAALQSKLKKGVKPVSAAAPGFPNGNTQLDANGHIPAGVGNDLIRQAANGIIDGRDPKEFGNPKVQTAALAMVDKFVPGYSRGVFTPLEKVQFKVATDFLHQLQDSKSLSVLDSFVSREKIAHAMKAPERMNLMDRIIAYKLDDKEAEFLRLFNAARGTVSGLSKITRSGRATNSQVSTIAQELPNVFQSSSSEDAKKRVEQLLKEADTALHTNPSKVGKGPVSSAAPGTPNKPLADRLNEALAGK